MYFLCSMLWGVMRFCIFISWSPPSVNSLSKLRSPTILFYHFVSMRENQQNIWGASISINIAIIITHHHHHNTLHIIIPRCNICSTVQSSVESAQVIILVDFSPRSTAVAVIFRGAFGFLVKCGDNMMKELVEWVLIKYL